MLRFLWGDLTAAVWGVEHVQGPCLSSHGFKTWHSLKTDGDRETLQKLQPMRAAVGFAELSVPQWAGERSDPLRRTYSFSIPRCTFFFPHTCRTKTTRPDSARCISGVKVAERSTGGHLRGVLTSRCHHQFTHRCWGHREQNKNPQGWLWRRNMNKGFPGPSTPKSKYLNLTAIKAQRII